MMGTKIRDRKSYEVVFLKDACHIQRILRIHSWKKMYRALTILLNVWQQNI